jgi:hypothetical protein
LVFLLVACGSLQLDFWFFPDNWIAGFSSESEIGFGFSPVAFRQPQDWIWFFLDVGFYPLADVKMLRLNPQLKSIRLRDVSVRQTADKPGK